MVGSGTRSFVADAGKCLNRSGVSHTTSVTLYKAKEE